MVCATSRVQQPGDYVCGQLGDVRYLLLRGQDGQLRAFHNVSLDAVCDSRGIPWYTSTSSLRYNDGGVLMVQGC